MKGHEEARGKIAGSPGHADTRPGGSSPVQKRYKFVFGVSFGEPKGLHLHIYPALDSGHLEPGSCQS